MSESGIRVLYIDDDPALQRLVRRHLERAGIAVTEATTGDDGLALLAGGGFDVVALDHYLPDRTGFEVLEAIGAHAAPPPVVYVTGTQDSRVAVTALKTGAYDYVIKDVEGGFFDLLKASLVGAVEAAELRRAREAAEREVREARDRFEALAAEREILIREINHRVSNSLQIVASFLQMQARTAQEPETAEVLKTAIQRVQAVAQVHQRLYTAHDLGMVALDAYFRELAEDLVKSGPRPAEMRISVEAEPVLVTADQAVAVGVIVTELVINAQKYAYPDGRGPIRLAVRQTGEGHVELVVEDDGVGRGGGTATGNGGLGTRILNAMGAKLDARIHYDDGHRGTRAVVSFAVTPAEAAA